MHYYTKNGYQKFFTVRSRDLGDRAVRRDCLFQALKQSPYVLPQHLMVITTLQQPESSSVTAAEGMDFNQFTDFLVILGREGPSPIVFVAVKTRGDSDNFVISSSLKVSGEGFHEFFTMISLCVEVTDLRGTAEDIRRPIANTSGPPSLRLGRSVLPQFVSLLFLQSNPQ